MSPSRLTPHDAGVLSKIKDPESTVSPILIDENIRRDPHILDMAVYNSIVETERAIVRSMLDLEGRAHSRGARDPKNYEAYQDDVERDFRTSQTSGWLACIMRLDKLIEQHPTYASALNNRAQALRVVYGDGMLVKFSTEDDTPVPDDLPSVMDEYSKDYDATLREMGRKILDDLSYGIHLLSPQTPFSPVSPLQAKTLANLYMQRGTLYLVAAQKLARNGDIITKSYKGFYLQGKRLHAEVRVKGEEEAWSSADFEQHASIEFWMAGRFGNEVGKGLAVSTNPNAKLCGQIVAEAMKKEIAGGD
jgi:hypothetical protein